MNHERSLALLRHAYPRSAIRFSYIYEDREIFAISHSGNRTTKAFDVSHEYVDSNGDIHAIDGLELLYNDPDGIKKAMRDAIYIDMKKPLSTR